MNEASLKTKEEYYADTSIINFSAIKVFSRCETLYRDIYITKVYAEPERDYFVYGKLVDAFVTEPPEFLKAHFVVVDRRVKPEDALKIENKIKELQEKNTLNADKVAAGNKTAIKGNASREKEIDELKIKLSVIRDIGDKEQVPAGLYEEAEQTALAIKTHPHFSSMVFDQFTSQQVIIAPVNGVMRKGRLDHLQLCPQIERVYKLFVANQITYEDMLERIKSLKPSELWAVITDIKSCYDLAKLEPFNTHYRGQLGFYQELVSSFLMIPIKQIRCRILAGDKLSNNFKKSELFEYTQTALDDLKPDVDQWIGLWKKAVESNAFVSAKAKHGMKQECYTCLDCRIAPFSKTPGQPVMIDGPRFGNNNNIPRVIFQTTDQPINATVEPLPLGGETEKEEVEVVDEFANY